jgi:hypothetical protein
MIVVVLSPRHPWDIFISAHYKSAQPNSALYVSADFNSAQVGFAIFPEIREPGSGNETGNSGNKTGKKTGNREIPM